MLFENSLLTQINLENPLPTLVEVEISRSLNTALRRTFHFFYLLAAEKFSSLAPFLPYGDEIYLCLHALMERFLLFNADTTFTELMFGLRRVRVSGPKSATLDFQRSSKSGSALSTLRFLLLGPSPIPSAEERAISFIAQQDALGQDSTLDPLRHSSGSSMSIADSIAAAAAASGVPSIESDRLAPALLHESSHNNNNADVLDHTMVGDEYSAGELISASRASYGYLKFSPITRRQRIISLVLLTLKPYMEKKLKQLYLSEMDNAPDAVALRTAYAFRYPIRAKVKKVFFGTLFPLLHLTQKSTELLFKLLYLCELTPYTSPLHRIFNLVVKRGSFEESQALTPQARRALTTARVLIFVVFFGFQLFELTRSTGFSGSALFDEDNGEATLPIPPPPVWGVDVTRQSTKKARRANRRDSTNERSDANDREEVEEDEGGEEGEDLPEVVQGQCPVCRKAITNPAVLTTSGVLGCYPCLQQHVREHLRCPVTNRTTTIDRIRRVFES